MVDLIRDREGDYVVIVEGHTDDTDIKSRKYPPNWELSSARAAKVLSVFEKAGIKRNRLVAVGYGDTRLSTKIPMITANQYLRIKNLTEE